MDYVLNATHKDFPLIFPKNAKGGEMTEDEKKKLLEKIEADSMVKMPELKLLGKDFPTIDEEW